MFSHIIGRILEENLNYISTKGINVRIGGLDPSSAAIKTGVLMNINVFIVMAGKNKNTIQIIIR